MTGEAVEYFIGVSCGVGREGTGVAVVERIGSKDAVYHVLQLEQLARGVAPKALVAWVTRSWGSLERRDAARQMRERRALLASFGIDGFGAGRWQPLHITLACDITGSGPAGVEPLRRARFWPELIVLHGGHEVQREPDGGWKVPKRDLAGRLGLLISENRLKVAGGLPDAEVLRARMEALTPRVNLGSHAEDSWRSGHGDALLLAVAVAIWLGETNPAPTFPAAVAAASTF